MITKIHDVGRTHDEMYGMPVSIGKNKKEKCYPSITVTTEQIPFLEDVVVGEKMSLLAICEVKSIRQEGKNKPMEITLDVKKLGEEGEMKMTKAVEKAIGEHKELDEE